MTTRAAKIEKICESPIETALCVGLLFFDRIDPPHTPLVLSNFAEIEHYGPDARLLVPQFPFENKRIDFLFRDPPVQVFIECDGHDFHERTKEQAARDRKRDRDLQQTGTPVLRFTGSEIYADPLGCVLQIYDFIGDLHMHDYFRKRA